MFVDSVLLKAVLTLRLRPESCDLCLQIDRFLRNKQRKERTRKITTKTHSSSSILFLASEEETGGKKIWYSASEIRERSISVLRRGQRIVITAIPGLRQSTETIKRRLK
jgi:hypothetical protein